MQIAAARPESFEQTSVEVPETEFKPEEVDLSSYTKADLHHNLPRDRAISISTHGNAERPARLNSERRATLTPKGLPSLFGGKHK